MQDNQKDKGREMKKRENHDTASSDSDSSQPEIGCETCGVNFSSIKAYESHMSGKKHQKKLSQEKFLAKYLAGNENGSKEDDESDDNGDSKLHCDVCDKSFSGHVSFLTHIKSSIHAKYVKKQKLKEKMRGMPEVLDKDNKENGATDDDDDDGIFKKPFARCDVCQKEFSGPESFAAHMKSAKHKKKEEVSKKLGDLMTKHQDGANKSDIEDDCFAKCEVCQKSFSGLIPYHVHMKSAIHKKNLDKNKVAEEMKKLCDSYDPSTGFVCKDCKKAFIDPVNFKNHLAHNSHEKQNAKNVLLEFLNKFPEIEFVTPFGDQAKDEGDDSDDSDHAFYLICKICHMSFSGPESAQDHVKSKKHISLKKEKGLQKLLKEQKKLIDGLGKRGDKKSSEKTDAKTNKSLVKNGVTAPAAEKSSAADDFEMI